MPPRASKGKAKKSSSKPTPRNPPVTSKNTRKRQASASEGSDDDTGPSQKQKSRKRKKQAIDVLEDSDRDIIPEEVEEDEDGEEVSGSIFAWISENLPLCRVVLKPVIQPQPQLSYL
jgi:hypothetical protein